MKIWMSENTKYKNKYALRLILSILAIVLISMVGLIALTFLSMEMNLPIQIISVVLTVLITGLIILLALRLGRKNQKDILIFVQDHQKRMYVINAMNYIHVSNELTALIQSAVQTERQLNQLKKIFYYAESDLNLILEGIVPQIVSVLNMKEDKNGYYLVCRMLSIHGQLYKQTYPVYHGYENEEELIYALRKLNAFKEGEMKLSSFNELLLIERNKDNETFKIVINNSNEAKDFVPNGEVILSNKFENNRLLTFGFAVIKIS